MKRSKPKYSYLFKSKAYSLHKRKMDTTYKVIGDHLPNVEYHIWARDF